MTVAYADTPLLVASSTELETYLTSELPVLLYLWNGETLRTDVKTELTNTAKTHAGRILVVTADAARAPELAERFELGKHPILIALVKGESLGRRSRPWATDIPGMVDLLLPHAPAKATKGNGAMKAVDMPSPAAAENTSKALQTKPVTVTDATFEQEVLKSTLPVMVDFWAEWCGPCRQVAPILDKLAAEFAGKIKIAKVDVDANPALSQSFRIMSIPTMMFVKNGKIVGQEVGALPEHILRDVVNQLIALKI
ncbi:MAG TPA: thioredoxin [Aggregatilineales bacterium]|nr:thioredoxin [Aggregatilineales bacterium]